MLLVVSLPVPVQSHLHILGKGTLGPSLLDREPETDRILDLLDRAMNIVDKLSSSPSSTPPKNKHPFNYYPLSVM
jgi:hypothetical protein